MKGLVKLLVVAPALIPALACAASWWNNDWKYGNPDAPAAADVTGSYDASQTLVLSFAETGGLPADATAYKNNPSASTAVLTPAAIIGGGAKFAGKESITVPATPSLRLLPNQGFTASAWLRLRPRKRQRCMRCPIKARSWIFRSMARCSAPPRWPTPSAYDQ